MNFIFTYLIGLIPNAEDRAYLADRSMQDFDDRVAPAGSVDQSLSGAMMYGFVLNFIDRPFLTTAGLLAIIYLIVRVIAWAVGLIIY